MKKIIVTGATSMIGVSIIEACLKNGITTIYAVVRPNTANLTRLPEDKRIVVVENEISDCRPLVEKIPEKCDVFYHLMWSHTGSDRNNDIQGQTHNIDHTLEAVKVAKRLGCRKFIGAGSQAEYGLLDLEKISPNSPVNPIQPYGIAKYAAGKLGAALAKQLEIDFFWVRIFSVYGKNDKPTTMIASSLRKMINGEKTSFTKGEQRWDYLNSQDAGEAFYQIGKKSVGNKVYCLGSGTAKPLYEFIHIMHEIANRDAELGLGDIPYHADTVMNLCADIEALTADTGWIPKITFEDGIREVVNEMKSF